MSDDDNRPALYVGTQDGAIWVSDQSSEDGPDVFFALSPSSARELAAQLVALADDLDGGPVKVWS